MVAEVIGSAAYQMILDSTKFERGATLTRDASRALNRTLRQIETPAEKHQKQIDLLEEAYGKGALTSEQLRRAVDKLDVQVEAGNDTTDDDQRSERQQSGSERVLFALS